MDLTASSLTLITVVQEAVADNSRAILVMMVDPLVMVSRVAEVSQEAVQALLVSQVRIKDRILDLKVIMETIRTSSLTRSVRAMTGLLRT